MAVTGSERFAEGGATVPVEDAGDVWPPPVAKIWITVPRDAGFAGLLIEPSGLTTAAWPSPDPVAVKLDGALGTTGMARINPGFTHSLRYSAVLSCRYYDWP
jgi:hypothetical protein